MKTYNELLNEFEATETLIANRTDEFCIGDIENFATFVQKAIDDRLFEFTQSNYGGTKPTKKEFSDILFSNHVLTEIFDLIIKKQILRVQMLDRQIAKTPIMN